MNLKNLFSDIIHECKSRSGLCPLDPTGGDGSTFDLILAVCLEENYSQIFELEKGNISEQTFKDWFITDFMTLHHKITSKYKKFNWDLD